MQSPPRLFCSVFLGILAALIIVNWSFFFATPWVEHGDIAVNALQIERAKQGHELLGNYSRFHFNHPGPAFFYAYAAGELLFHDWLHLCPTPHNAHTLTGLAIQAFFFALTLVLAAQWVRRPLFVPLALFAGAVHFGLTEYAFLSLWPPHVLLMPFLAFWVACVSVAAGRGHDLPWAVLAGSFLVHGHVAQPLFVAGLFLPAYGLLVRRARHAGLARPWRAHPWAHAAAALLLAVFLLPIVLDLARGAASNFHDILRHLQYNGGDRKSPVSSILYLLSFFGYETRQADLLTHLNRQSLDLFTAHWPAFTCWLGLIGGLVVGVRRGWFAPEARLAGIGWLALHFWLGTAALCVVWGVMQAGPMMDFNGYFYYGFIYLVLLAAAALVSSRPALASPPHWLIPVLLLGAVATGALKFRLPGPDANQQEILSRDMLLDVLAARPERDRPILLSFNHHDWPEVVMAALVLKRQGVPFYADENWEFMFQEEHLVPTAWLKADQPPMEVWRFIPRTAGAPGLRFTKGLNLVLTPQPLAADHGDIDFSSQGNIGLYLSAGLASPEDDSSWTSQPDVLLQFRPDPAVRDVEMQIIATPFLPGKRIEMQPTELRFNGRLLFSSPFTEPGVLRVRIPREIWNQHPVAALHLHFPNAKAPSQVGVSSDVRILALAVKRLTTRLADVPPP